MRAKRIVCRWRPAISHRHCRACKLSRAAIQGPIGRIRLSTTGTRAARFPLRALPSESGTATTIRCSSIFIMQANTSSAVRMSPWRRISFTPPPMEGLRLLASSSFSEAPTLCSGRSLQRCRRKNARPFRPILPSIQTGRYRSIGAYRYEGSPTTPPCSETVDWHLLQSRSQTKMLRLSRNSIA